jgi:hypothetical protein
MMRPPTLVLWLCLLVLPAQALPTAEARDVLPLRLVAVVNLEKLLADKKTATVDAGGGITLELTTAAGNWQQNLTILADGHKLEALEGGRFIACARVEAGAATYWAISEYTGGAHCCAQFAFLSRGAAGAKVRYLGKTMGYNGGPRDFPGSFKYRQGQSYFESFDNRFDYFHASHADSQLVNVPRCYYRLNPTGLTVDNLPFQDSYLSEVAAVDREIKQAAGRQGPKPQAILQTGFQPGFESTVFSDPVGQLLVKRTILYLYAHKDRQAWEALQQDVARYYRTTAWVPELQQEIEKILSEHPY